MRSSASADGALTRPCITKTPTSGGIAFAWIRLSKTIGALYWTPSWKTMTGAGLVRSSCFGTYTQYSRHVPG